MSFKQRLGDLWPFIFMSSLTTLTWIANSYGVRSTTTIVVQTFDIPFYFVFGIFLFSSVITGLLFLPWWIRAGAILPVVVYSVLIIPAYGYSGINYLSASIASFIWVSMGITLIINMVILQDNHVIREELRNLGKQVKSAKEEFEKYKT